MRMLLKISCLWRKETRRPRAGRSSGRSSPRSRRSTREAAYFYPEDGKRTAVMVFDMEGSWELPPTVEPLFQDLGASVHVTPEMNGEDLQRGFKRSRHVGPPQPSASSF